MSKKYIEYLGMKKAISEWADYFCVPRTMVYHRLDRGWPIERIFERQKKHYTRMITIDGVTKPMSLWAKSAGISRALLWNRVRSGWTGQRLLQKPRNFKITAWGRSQTGSQWAKETGIPQSTIFYRINHAGLSPEAALSLPVDKRLASKGRKPYQESRKTDLVGD